MSDRELVWAAWDGLREPVGAAAATIADGEGELPPLVHYRETANHDRACATCSFYGAGTAMRCGMFDTLVSPAMVCDEWAEGLPGVLPEQWQWSDLAEVTPPLVSAAPGVTSLSTMIAVKPRPLEAEAIAAPGGDPPENLHVTLAYLGEIEGELEPIVDALRIVAATHAPLEGVIGGYGAFDPPGVGILLPDVRGLVELRTDVCEALIAAEIDYSHDHGFEAHLTVTDVDGEPADGYPESAVGNALHFDELLVVRGDTEIIAIPFTGALPITAAALVAAAEPFCLPAELRGKTDPIRQAFVKAVMTPALEQAGLTWDITNPLAADVISRAGQHIVGISRTTQDDVMNVINYAHEQGLSVPDTAKAIRAHMAEASNVRATMIARTELAGAVNGGSLAAAKIAADVAGATATKTWMTAPGATYPRHEDYEGLDGQTVQLDGLFDVGGAELRFPGDPDGEAGEVINCRCTLEYSGERKSDTAGDNIDAAGEQRFSLEHHNRVLRAAHKRIDDFEPRLAAILQPILERAGDIAALRFEQLATNHLTAADDPANPAGWTPPAAEEILPVNCEELTDAGGLTSGHAEAGIRPLSAPSAGSGPGRPVVSFAETTDYESFNSALAENARPGFLTVHTPEELARDKVFISPDGESGFVVTPEHDLQNVFRNPGGIKGAGQQAVRKAVQEEGAATLDAYDGFLPDMYEQEGFRVVGRMKFVDEYAPEGWKFEEYGRPDIVFMAQNAPAETEVRLFTDWDEAKAYAASVAGEPIPPEVLDSAKAMISDAAAAEPEVTAELSGIADTAGGKMEGLENAVKENPSLVRKITGDLADARLADPSATVAEVSASINDTLRYTMTFPDGSYANGVQTTLARLEKDGYTQIKLKNYWGNADYQGINGVFEKNGQRFELQFHTPRTFELKTSLHPQYRAFQLSTDPAERLRLWNEMAAEQSKNPVPAGAFGIGQRVTHDAPVGADVMRVLRVQDIVPGANNLTMDRTMENINYVAERQAQTQGGRWKMIGTPEERAQRLEEWKAEALTSIKKAVADAQVRIRVTTDTLEKILKEGRFKSQFETGTSKGMLDADLRARAEERMFGYPKSLPDEERPIYGYLAGSADETHGVEQYGDLIVNLKPETNERTTFSLIDSLGPGRDGEIIPSPLNDPSLTSWWGGANPVEANGDVADMTYGSYAEAQIHGGVALSDIDQVIFSAEREQERIQGATAMANIMRDNLAEKQRELDALREAVKGTSNTSALAAAEDAVARAQEQADEWLARSEQTMMEGTHLRELLDELEIRWHMVDTYRELGGGNSQND